MDRYKIKLGFFKGYTLEPDPNGEVVKYEDAKQLSVCGKGSRWQGNDKDRVIEILEGRLENARREINELNKVGRN